MHQVHITAFATSMLQPKIHALEAKSEACMVRHTIYMSPLLACMLVNISYSWLSCISCGRQLEEVLNYKEERKKEKVLESAFLALLAYSTQDDGRLHTCWHCSATLFSSCLWISTGYIENETNNLNKNAKYAYTSPYLAIWLGRMPESDLQ